LIELADSGTLFLDEIGDMESALQRKVLRLLQDGLYSRLGECEERQSRARVISATNSEMEEAVGSRAFRRDLFYRIEVMTLSLLPLRERKKDIPELCSYFMHRLSKRFGKCADPLSPSSLSLLMQWDWPGNIRELENWVARVIVLGSEKLPSQELSSQMALIQAARGRQPQLGRLKDVSRRAASAPSREVVLRVLQANHGNRRKTAEQLNMSYRSLLYKLRELDVQSRRPGHKELPPL
jgi:transcriptional regulator with PAS, ATPase and Fis domain